MVQLARLVPDLPDPVRQFVVRDEDGNFVARVDLCWPDLGLFIELDGQQHKGQPVYDANRETAVVRGHRLAVRPLHLARSRPHTPHDGPTACGPRGSGPPAPPGGLRHQDAHQVGQGVTTFPWISVAS